MIATVQPLALTGMAGLSMLAPPAGANSLLWQDQWAKYGSCAQFAGQREYFSFALAAAKKYDVNVSCCCRALCFNALCVVADVLATTAWPAESALAL